MLSLGGRAGSSPVSLPGSPFEPFRQKIVLHCQPPDLGVQFLDFSLGRATLLAAREHVCHSVDGLPLPGADLVRMQLMLRCDLLHGLVATQRFQRDLGFSLICKVPAPCHLRILQTFGIHLNSPSSFLGPLHWRGGRCVRSICPVPRWRACKKNGPKWAVPFSRCVAPTTF